MGNIEVGEVLWFKMKFKNSGATAKSKHPYLIVEIDKTLNIVEIAQLSSLKGKEYRAAFKSNKTIYSDNPMESVIYEDSIMQMDNTFKVEYHSELEKYKQTQGKLSKEKLSDAISEYRKYHEENFIEEDRQVYMSQTELGALNTKA